MCWHIRDKPAVRDLYRGSGIVAVCLAITGLQALQYIFANGCRCFWPYSFTYFSLHALLFSIAWLKYFVAFTDQLVAEFSVVIFIPGKEICRSFIESILNNSLLFSVELVPGLLGNIVEGRIGD